MDCAGPRLKFLTLPSFFRSIVRLNDRAVIFMERAPEIALPTSDTASLGLELWLFF